MALRKLIASIATVTVRDSAIFEAKMPPPMSIWLSSQPPKMSPLALVSAGIAMVRMQRSPDGSVSALDVACAAGVSVMGKGSSFSLASNVLRWLDGSHAICKKLQKRKKVQGGTPMLECNADF